MRRKIKSLFGISNRRRRVFVEAVPLLLSYSILCKYTESKKIFASFRRLESERQIMNDDAMMDMARDIAWAAEAGGRNLPWHPVCLPQALCASRMMHQRGLHSVIHIGVKVVDTEVVDEPFLLHAWLSFQGKVLVGRRGHDNYAKVVSYVRKCL